MKIARLTHASGEAALVPVEHVAWWQSVTPDQERILGGPHTTLHMIGQSWLCVKGDVYEVEALLQEASK